MIHFDSCWWPHQVLVHLIHSLCEAFTYQFWLDYPFIPTVDCSQPRYQRGPTNAPSLFYLHSVSFQTSWPRSSAHSCPSLPSSVSLHSISSVHPSVHLLSSSNISTSGVLSSPCVHPHVRLSFHMQDPGRR